MERTGRNPARRNPGPNGNGVGRYRERSPPRPPTPNPQNRDALGRAALTQTIYINDVTVLLYINGQGKVHNRAPYSNRKGGGGEDVRAAGGRDCKCAGGRLRRLRPVVNVRFT